MRKFYKYYSSNLDIKTYLTDPTIRLSQLHSLNDPFEGMLPDNLMNKLIPVLQKKLYPEDLDSKFYRRHTKLSIIKFIDDYGIASVSETHRNLLMWSHYASEHKGCCIGYDPKMFDDKNIFYEKLLNTSKVFDLKKINYDSVPFDSEIIDEIVSADFDKDEPFELLAEKALTTKSDAWSYEKEHRYISNINLCDQIVITRKKQNLASYMIAAVERAQSNDLYEVFYDEAKVTLKSKRKNNIIKSNIYKNSCQVIKALHPSKDVIFLSNISKVHVNSIYLGARYDHNKKDELIDAINSDPELQHIKVYQYSESKLRYELTEEKIYPA